MRLLLDRDFGGFFWGKLVSASAIYLHAVVAALAVYGATRSATAVAVVSVAQFAPQLLLAPTAGVWADRGSVGRQIVLGRLVCAVGSGALASWWLVASEGSGWSQVVVVAATSLIVGIGLVIGGPAMQSVPPLLVRRDELPSAMALNTAPMTVGRIAGPVLGAGTVEIAGYVPALAAATAGQLFFVAVMTMVRLPGQAKDTQGASSAGSIGTALAHVRSDRGLLLLLVLAACLGIGSEPITTMAPAIAARLGGDATDVGVLTGSFGLGALLGILVSSWFARRLRHRMVAATGVILLALGVGVCGSSPDVATAAVAAAVAGAGFIVASSSTSTLIQLRVPEEMRGRVMALWLMGFVGSRPLAALTAGTIADLASVEAACAVVAIFLGCVAVMCRPRRLV